MPDRPPVFVHLLPNMVPPGSFMGGVAVVIDVLRATTVMCHALAAGCEVVIPCLEIEEARTAAANQPTGTALLGGERGGLPISGFDLGNSPQDYTPQRCQGKTLVMTTTNGTRAIYTCLGAERVVIAAFVNRKAVGDALRKESRPIHLVCAGTEGAVSLEDSLLAGAIVAELGGAAVAANDEAEIAHATWSAVLDSDGLSDPGRLSREVHAWLCRGRGGRNVGRIGLGTDIQAAAQLDQFDFTPELRRDPLRVVRPGRTS